jgi:hypothetical protein
MAYDYESLIKTYEDIASGYESMTGAGTTTGNVNTNPNSSGYGYNINRTGSTPSGYYGSYSTPGGNLITIGAPPTTQQQSSQQSSGSAKKSSSGGGYSSGASYSLGYQGPTVDKPEYQTTEFKGPGEYKAPEYAPPEYDDAVEKKLRSEYMAPGMRQVRQSTAQAITSSKSLDNPNARALFIEKALSGVGDAISSVSATAGKEARSAAMDQYKMDMEKYNFGWKALSDEAKTNYDSEWQKAIMDFQESRYANQMDYQMQANLFSQMPLDQQASAYSGSGGNNPLSWSYTRY